MKTAHRSTWFTAAIATAALLASAAGVAALPPSPHYPAGAEGIRAATLPPPGIYLRDYTFFYHADRLDGGPPGHFSLAALINAPRLIWMTDLKLLGADYGMDLIVPFGCQRVKIEALGSSRDDCGIGDIQIEPLLLAWHGERFDAAAGYALWAPTGDFDPGEPEHLGRGFWTHMLTGGATCYLDADKTFALSALCRYEISTDQDDTDVEPGDVFTLELAASKTVAEGVDLGIAAYWQQEVTESSGEPARAQVFAIGPEASIFWPKAGLFTSFRYLHEFSANRRPEGDQFVLTLTKRF